MNLFTVVLTICTVFAVSNVYSQTARPATAREARSEHFVVDVYPGGPSAQKVLKLCEASRIELQRIWGTGNALNAWAPRCEVVVHGTRQNYLDVVGQGGEQTRGSSLIQLDGGKILTRRIDLLFDPQSGLTALPHELTHVVLADQFQESPPHWLDEGIAMLADTRDKQLLHHRDCRDAIASRTTLPLANLLTLEQFTSPGQMPAFYGQSLALIQMLAKRSDPKKIVAFGVTARKIGYERALRDHFAINGIADLERHWNAHVADINAATLPQPIVMVSFQP